jgi:hypothetical protein
VPSGRAVFIIIALISCGCEPGNACINKAATPATIGAEKDVPVTIVYEPPAEAAYIPTPGAIISGLICSVNDTGPRDENPAISSDIDPLPPAVPAPTVIARDDVPGEVNVYDPDAPVLPAAATTTTPSITATLVAYTTGSNGLLVDAPKLMFITFAPSLYAAVIAESAFPPGLIICPSLICIR